MYLYIRFELKFKHNKNLFQINYFSYINEQCKIFLSNNKYRLARIYASGFLSPGVIYFQLWKCGVKSLIFLEKFSFSTFVYISSRAYSDGNKSFFLFLFHLKGSGSLCFILRYIVRIKPIKRSSSRVALK